MDVNDKIVNGEVLRALIIELEKRCVGTVAVDTSDKTKIIVSDLKGTKKSTFNIVSTVDSALSSTSIHPVQNKVINTEIEGIKQKLAETGIPLGFEYFSINPNVPLGSLPLIGGTYSRTLYKDLWDWVQTQTGYLKTEAEWTILFNRNNGNVPFYSSGDGSTTFRVPSLKCWVKSGSSISEVGSYLEAQYPRIEHYHAFGYNSGNNNGRFIATNETKTYNLPNNVGFRGWNGSGGGGGYSSDADSAANANMVTSLSVEVQGNSDTVQPPSIVGLWLVKAFSAISNVGNKDLQSVITRMDEIDANRLKLCIYTD